MVEGSTGISAQQQQGQQRRPEVSGRTWVALPVQSKEWRSASCVNRRPPSTSCNCNPTWSDASQSLTIFIPTTRSTPCTFTPLKCERVQYPQVESAYSHSLNTTLQGQQSKATSLLLRHHKQLSAMLGAKANSHRVQLNSTAVKLLAQASA